MPKHLLPPNASTLEIAADNTSAHLEKMPVPIRDIWNPDTCPERLLPYLAWAFSVDRWDKDWPEQTKRDAIKASMFIHQHKGTIGAIRRVVEPLGYVINVKEWWKTNGTPGTFSLDIGVLDIGITPQMQAELENLIFDAKPVSRHLTGLSIQLESRGSFYGAASCYTGDELTVYPYTPPVISVSSHNTHGAAVHLIDEIRIATP